MFVLAKTELHSYTGTGEDKVPRSRAATPLLLRRFGIVEAGRAQKVGCHSLNLKINTMMPFKFKVGHSQGADFDAGQGQRIQGTKRDG